MVRPRETSLVAQTVKRLPAMQETWVQSLGQEDTLEKEMATHSSTLAWKIPWTEGLCRLQSLGSQRVGHNLTTGQQRRMRAECREWVHALKREAPGTPSLLQPHEDPREVLVIYEPGNGLSSDTKHAVTLILDLLVFKTVRNKFMLFISLWNSVIAAQTELT